MRINSREISDMKRCWRNILDLNGLAVCIAVKWKCLLQVVLLLTWYLILKVTFDENYLHSIDMNEFVNAPEYDCYNNDTGTEDTYQVTISAVEDSLLFLWPQKSLIEHLAKDAILEHIFDQVIGKDICQKLYKIQERQICNTNAPSDTLLERRPSMVNVRHSIVSNSTSNLTKLNCLQDCLINTEQPSLQSSNSTYETSV